MIPDDPDQLGKQMKKKMKFFCSYTKLYIYLRGMGSIFVRVWDPLVQHLPAWAPWSGFREVGS